MRTRVAESGQNSRELFRETGISADENQARRLLNDIASFRGYLEQKNRRPISFTVAAHRWLAEVYDPATAAIPDGLRGRLPPPEVFHEILEHRLYLLRRPAATSAPPPPPSPTSLPSCPPSRSRSLPRRPAPADETVVR